MKDPTAAASASLCDQDKLVLETIFNPNTPFNETFAVENSTDRSSTNTFSHDEEAETRCKAIDVEAISSAERGDFTLSKRLFGESLAIAPLRAAGYNNRAQLHRLTGDLDAALLDLERAILLSEGRGLTACQAFTQRAMIRRLKGDENGSRCDFQHAADLGSSFAKQQLVLLNPYAALCNSMLQEMVTKVRCGEPTNEANVP